MTADRASGRTRALVLAAHVAALLGGLAYAWSQWTDIAAQEAAVDQTRQTVAQLEARLAQSGGLHAPTDLARRDPFIPGDSAALSGANLQDRVVSAIRAAGGTVTSSQVDTSGAGLADGAAPTPPAIQITVSCQLRNAALQGLLYAFETDVPALFIDEITIEGDARSAGPANGGDLLKISMVISGYWTGGGKS